MGSCWPWAHEVWAIQLLQLLGLIESGLATLWHDLGLLLRGGILTVGSGFVEGCCCGCYHGGYHGGAP
ncbi:hypothetical protein ACFX13_030421 [Malus domestica]